MIFRKWLTLAAMFFMSSAAPAQELPTPPINKTVLSGEKTRVWMAYDLNPDCSPRGEIRLRLIEPPKHGDVEMVTEKGFTTYPKDRQMYSCNEKQSDVHAYYYHSRDGFTGKDRFVGEVFYSNGAYRKAVINVDVR
jgi:hypothetical protein